MLQITSIVCSYGLFARMTQFRHEIIFQGTDNTKDAQGNLIWKQYELMSKPGDINRMPPWDFYHMPRLDWRLWFLPLRPFGRRGLWYLKFMSLILENKSSALSLLSHNPFPEGPPQQIR